MHIKKGDQVVVISGADKGKRGKVLRVFQENGRVIVEGVAMMKKHVRANPQKGIQGGILEQEAPIPASRLLPIDPETNKPTRVGYKILDAEGGKTRKVRIARRSGAELDK